MHRMPEYETGHPQSSTVAMKIRMFPGCGMLNVRMLDVDNSTSAFESWLMSECLAILTIASKVHLTFELLRKRYSHPSTSFTSFKIAQSRLREAPRSLDAPKSGISFVLLVIMSPLFPNDAHDTPNFALISTYSPSHHEQYALTTPHDSFSVPKSCPSCLPRYQRLGKKARQHCLGKAL